MSVAWVAVGVSAVVGAAASASSANAQASAATAAGRAQQQAALANQAGQAQQYNRAQGTLGPYSREGANARGYYNALLGVRSNVGGGADSGATGGKDWKAYEEQWRPTTVENRTSPFFADLERQRAANPNISWGEAFYNWSGGRYGEPGTLAAEGRDQTDAELAASRDGAYQAFEASPYSAAAQYGETKGMQAIMGAAGAGGGVLRGRTANALADNARGYKANALLSYMNDLNGVAARGFDADSGIVSAGQTFANNSGAAALQGANAQANALMGAGQAKAGMYSDIAGFASMLGGMAYGSGGAKTTQKPGSYYAPVSNVTPTTFNALSPSTGWNNNIPRVG